MGATTETIKATVRDGFDGAAAVEAKYSTKMKAPFYKLKVQSTEGERFSVTIFGPDPEVDAGDDVVITGRVERGLSYKGNSYNKITVDSSPAARNPGESIQKAEGGNDDAAPF